MCQRCVQRSAAAGDITNPRSQSATDGAVHGGLIRQVLRSLLHGRLLAGLLHARPIACGFGGFEEQATLPAGAGLAGSGVVDLLEHAWHAQKIGRFERTYVRKQRLGIRQIADDAVIGGDRTILDETCETVCQRQEQQQARMVVSDHLMQGHACGTRDRNEIAMREFRALRSSGGTGRVYDGRQIVGLHRTHARGKLFIGYGHAHAFQRAHGIGIKHENMLQRRAVVDD